MPQITQSQTFQRISNVLKARVPAFTGQVWTTTTLRDNPNQGFGLTSASIRALAAPIKAEFNVWPWLQLDGAFLDWEKPDTVWELAGVVCERLRDTSESEIDKMVIKTIKAVLGSGTVVTTSTTFAALGLDDKKKGQFADELNHTFIDMINLGLQPSDIQQGTVVSDWSTLIVPKFAAQSRI